MTYDLRSGEEATVTDFAAGQLSISIFVDDDDALTEAQLAVYSAGARMIANSSIADAASWEDQPFFGDIVLIELVRDDGPLLDRFLDRMAALARGESQAIVVNAASGRLDAVAARLWGPRVTILSQATVTDRIAALTVAGMRPETAFHESGTDDTLRLQRLADEVGRIARTLADLASSEPVPVAFSDGLIGFRSEPQISAIPRTEPQIVAASDVRAMIRLRRMRDRYFRGELFADPAWDMLLDLMAARIEKLRVAVSSLCIAAAVPPTTALRWIKTMTENGIFVRVADPSDGRRVFIELSDGAAAGMSAYLADAKRNGALAI